MVNTKENAQFLKGLGLKDVLSLIKPKQKKLKKNDLFTNLLEQFTSIVGHLYLLHSYRFTC